MSLGVLSGVRQQPEHVARPLRLAHAAELEQGACLDVRLTGWDGTTFFGESRAAEG